jgi:hypothetical protein
MVLCRTVTVFSDVSPSGDGLPKELVNAFIEVLMRNRINYVVMAALVVVAGLVWLVVKSQRAPVLAAVAPVAPLPQASLPPTPVRIEPVRIEIVQVPVAALGTPAVPRDSQSASMQSVTPAIPQEQITQPISQRSVTAPQTEATERHVAQPGETVNSLAGDLLGKDSKSNRDAIINANASLKSDPDKLVAGKTYRIPSAADATSNDSADALPAPVAPASAAIKPDAVADRVVEPVAKAPRVKVLKYTAAPGDTVGKMAAAFLGDDNQSNEDAIIAANPSLHADPDHVEVGRAYRIPTVDGLSASSVTPTASPRPTSQPDADQLVVAGSPRELRYTAVAGDTVSKMAIQLLGNDTQETRDLIIKNNPSLKKDPDRVIEGQTYWIPAPSASADAR